MPRVLLPLCLTGLLAAGCTAAPMLPDLTAIYARVAEAGGTSLEHPLITVPGTLGSRLRDSDSGRLIWGGGSRGLSADPDDPEEARLIALPIVGTDVPLADLRDGLEADGVLDIAPAQVLGIPIDIEVYGGVARTLTAGGFRADPSISRPAAPRPAGPPTVEDYARIAAPSANAYRFDYDWRHDIPAIARRFDAFVTLRKRQVAALRSLAEGRNVAPEEVTFDILAHSMGGLVVRYYLMHGAADLPADGSLPPLTWEGARHFRRVVFVAPPNAGSVLALDNLVNGKSLGAFQPVYPGALLATHPSVWQLLPRARHGRLIAGGQRLDPLDPAVWERFGWGLAGPGAGPFLALMLPDVGDPAERRRIAMAHQARLLARAGQFHRAMDRWSRKPEGLELFLVVGGGFATPAAAEVDPVTGALRLSAREEGDGVVLRASSLLDERQGGRGGGALATPLRFDTVLFLPDEHVALTRNPVFGDNLLFWLLEQPREPAGLAEPRRPGLLGAGTAARGRGQPGPLADPGNLR